MTANEQRRLRDVILGPPRDPMSPQTRKHIALAAFLAWIGIGAPTVSRRRPMAQPKRTWRSARFKNFVFVTVGTVDSQSYGSEQTLRTLQYETRSTLDALVNFVHCQANAARWYDAYGSDRLVELEKLSLAVREDFPNSVFFASRLVFENEHWWNRWLHSQTPLAIQRVLNTHGLELVILLVMLHYGAPPDQIAGSALSH